MEIEIDEFHKLVGEIMMFCQCIEENIRKIYAKRMPGDYGRNLIDIDEQHLTMGQMVTKLKELDYQLPHPLFEAKDYEMLFAVVKKRNYYAHKVYLSFCYIADSDTLFQQCYQRACGELLKDYNALYPLYEIVEEVRYAYVN